MKMDENGMGEKEKEEKWLGTANLAFCSGP